MSKNDDCKFVSKLHVPIIFMLTIFLISLPFLLQLRFVKLLEKINFEHFLDVYTSIVTALITFIGVAYSINLTLRQNDYHLEERNRHNNIQAILDIKKKNLDSVRDSYNKHLVLAEKIHNTVYFKKDIDEREFNENFQKMTYNFVELRTFIDSEKWLNEIDSKYLEFENSIINYKNIKIGVRNIETGQTSKIYDPDKYDNYIKCDLDFSKAVSEYIKEAKESLFQSFRIHEEVFF